MKSRLYAVLAVMAVVVVMSTAVNSSFAGGGAGGTVTIPEGFESVWSEAVKKATAENKPIYVHFTTDWCGWCRRIEEDTYADE